MNAIDVFTTDHLFYFSVDTDYELNPNYTTVLYGPSNQAWFSRNKLIWRWPSNNQVQSIFGFRYEAVTLPGVYHISNVMVFDLTQMFGSDANIAAALGITTAEITTDVGVSAFERWLEENVGPKEYYANGKDICFVSRYLLLYNIRNQFKS